MEGSDDGRDNVGAPNDGLVGSLMIQEDIEYNPVYILAPGIGYDIPQNDPTTNQLKLPNESLAGVDTDAHEFKDFRSNAGRWTISQ